jgi:hypothetical protein
VVHNEKDSALQVNTQELIARIFTFRGKDLPVDVNGIIERLRLVYGAKNDSQLSQALNLGKSATSNWRHRNAPPVDICFETACSKGVSMDWLLFGVGDMPLGQASAAPVVSLRNGSFPSQPAVERISRFVDWWGANRSQDEMAWLEQQLRRAVPEYGEWLTNPEGVVPR